MDDPTPPDRFLGRYTEEFNAQVNDLKFILENNPKLHPRGVDKAQPYVPKDPQRRVRGYSYNMTQYLQQNVQKYLSTTGVLQ